MYNYFPRTGLGRDEDQSVEIVHVPSRIGYRLRFGKARTAILLWLLGVPIPLILLILLIRSCM